MEWGIKPEAKRIRRVPLPGFLAAEGLICADGGVPMETVETERGCRIFFVLRWLSHRTLEEFLQESEGHCSPAKHCEKRRRAASFERMAFSVSWKAIHFTLLTSMSLSNKTKPSVALN